MKSQPDHSPGRIITQSSFNKYDSGNAKLTKQVLNKTSSQKIAVNAGSSPISNSSALKKKKMALHLTNISGMGESQGAHNRTGKASPLAVHANFGANSTTTKNKSANKLMIPSHSVSNVGAALSKSPTVHLQS